MKGHGVAQWKRAAMRRAPGERRRPFRVPPAPSRRSTGSAWLFIHPPGLHVPEIAEVLERRLQRGGESRPMRRYAPRERAHQQVEPVFYGPKSSRRDALEDEARDGLVDLVVAIPGR